MAYLNIVIWSGRVGLGFMLYCMGTGAGCSTELPSTPVSSLLCYGNPKLSVDLDLDVHRVPRRGAYNQRALRRRLVQRVHGQVHWGGQRFLLVGLIFAGFAVLAVESGVSLSWKARASKLRRQDPEREDSVGVREGGRKIPRPGAGMVEVIKGR